MEKEKIVEGSNISGLDNFGTLFSSKNWDKYISKYDYITVNNMLKNVYSDLDKYIIKSFIRYINGKVSEFKVSDVESYVNTYKDTNISEETLKRIRKNIDRIIEAFGRKWRNGKHGLYISLKYLPSRNTNLKLSNNVMKKIKQERDYVFNKFISDGCIHSSAIALSRCFQRMLSYKYITPRKIDNSHVVKYISNIIVHNSLQKNTIRTILSNITRVMKDVYNIKISVKYKDILKYASNIKSSNGGEDVSKKDIKKINCKLSNKELMKVYNIRRKIHEKLKELGDTHEAAVKNSRVIESMLEYEYIDPEKITEKYIFNNFVKQNTIKPVKAKSIISSVNRVRYVLRRVYNKNIGVIGPKIVDYLDKNVKKFKEKQMSSCFRTNGVKGKNSTSNKECNIKKIESIVKFVFEKFTNITTSGPASLYARSINNMLLYKYIEPTKITKTDIENFLVHMNLDKKMTRNTACTMISRIKTAISKVYGVTIECLLGEILSNVAIRINGFKDDKDIKQEDVAKLDIKKVKKLLRIRKHIYDTIIKSVNHTRAKRAAKEVINMLEYKYIEPSKIDYDYILKYFTHTFSINPVKTKTFCSILYRIKYVMDKVYGIRIKETSTDFINHFNKHVKAFKEYNLSSRKTLIKENMHNMSQEKHSEKARLTKEKFVRSIVDAVKKSRVKRGCNPDNGKKLLCQSESIIADWAKGNSINPAELKKENKSVVVSNVETIANITNSALKQKAELAHRLSMLYYQLDTTLDNIRKIESKLGIV